MNMCFSKNESKGLFVIHFKHVWRVFSDHFKPFSISLLQGQGFSRNQIVSSEDRTIKKFSNFWKYLWTLFFYTRDSLVCWFLILLVFSMKMSQKYSKYAWSEQLLCCENCRRLECSFANNYSNNFTLFQPFVHTY